MSYRRPYTYQEVHDLLCESEGRASPKTGMGGHSVDLHADGRKTIRNRDTTTIVLAETIEQSRRMNPNQGFLTETKWAPGVDSRFTSRGDMVKALFQAINSPAGQALLQQFDTSATQDRVQGVIALSKSIPRIERFRKTTGTLE